MAKKSDPGKVPHSAAGIPQLDSASAWSRLPQPKIELPILARQLAGPMPMTASAMLAQDYLHRAKNPMGVVLASKLRWAGTTSQGINYAKQATESDLHRAGLSKLDLCDLADQKLNPADQLALKFARQLTHASSEVNDDAFLPRA